jgi:hypothetical protein
VNPEPWGPCGQCDDPAEHYHEPYGFGRRPLDVPWEAFQRAHEAGAARERPEDGRPRLRLISGGDQS